MSSIAIIGSRGIPAAYGGFERVAEKLAEHLSEKGYIVTVSCDRNRGDADRRMRIGAVRLAYSPFPEPTNYRLHKYYEVFNDVFFMLRLAPSSNVIYLLGCGAGAFAALPKIVNRGVALIVNIDGVEWRRAKFSRFEQVLLRLSAWAAIFFADIVVVDSRKMADFIGRRWKTKVAYAANGVDDPPKVQWETSRLTKLKAGAEKWEIIPRNYWLVVARLEPENNIAEIVEGFLSSGSSRLLVVVGDFTSARYEKKVRDATKTSSSVVFTGSIHDHSLLSMLRQHAFGYLHGHTVGGTNPSLLEAMSSRNLIMAHSNPFNRETCGEFALFFEDPIDLGNQIKAVERETKRFSMLGDQAAKRASDEYSWGRAVSDMNSIIAVATAPTASRKHRKRESASELAGIGSAEQPRLSRKSR